MSLPIIRLREVDANHATAADDPVTAFCTLYTFLRSVPSDVECEMTMLEFKHAVQGIHRPTYLSKNNTKVLNLLHLAIHDNLLRYPPKVTPALARSGSSWRTLLNGGGVIGTANEPTLQAVPFTGQQNITDAAYDRLSDRMPLPSHLSSSSLSSSFSLAPGMMRSSSNNNEKKNGGKSVEGGEKDVIVVKESVSVDSMRFMSPYGPLSTSSLIGAPHTLHSDGLHNLCVEESNRVAEESLRGSSPTATVRPSVDLREGGIHRGYQPHPLLLALQERVRSTLPAEESVDDLQEREFVTLIESRAAALRTKMSEAISMISPEEGEALEFVHQLKTRVDVAERLFEAQRHEEETIQISHCALKIEITTMKALLRKIVDAVREAEERHEREGPGTPHCSEERHVMALIRQALDDISAM